MSVLTKASRIWRWRYSGLEEMNKLVAIVNQNYELTCQEGPVLTAVAALRAKYQGGTEILDDCMARPPQTTNDFSGNPVEMESYECRCI